MCGPVEKINITQNNFVLFCVMEMELDLILN